MNIEATRHQHLTIDTLQPDDASLSSQTIQEAVDRAGRRIAPLWSLRHFVAVNPYMGLADHRFEAAAQIMSQRAGARMTAPRGFYAAAIDAGRISDADLKAALADADTISGAPQDIDALKAFAHRDPATSSGEIVPTVADVATRTTGKNWSEIVVESISRWAGAYFDQGQAYWKSPWRDLPPYAAWRAEAAIDRTPEVSGVQHFRQFVSELPDDATDTIEAALNVLQIPEAGLEAYLHRLLLTIHGWASYARYHLWDAELHGRDDTTLTELLAIRLVWEVALLKALANDGLPDAWHEQKHHLAFTQLNANDRAAIAGDLLLQRAFEKAYQRQLFDRMAAAPSTPEPTSSSDRAQMQAAFCIDVRSEVFRRALETVSDSVETIGFAGFFGFPIEYVRLGETHGGAQCPALITPQFIIEESVSNATADEQQVIENKRTIAQQAAKAWRLFKFGAASCFGFVGPVGLKYMTNLIMDTFGRGRPVPDPNTFGLDKETQKRLSPALDRQEKDGRITGMTPDERLDVAEGMLRAMSLTDNFARVVLLAGHGSETVNNPYASGLDCGACGGHSGEANARVAVQVLNDPQVRSGLQARGITIPDDTIFVAGLHNTTTDEVTLFDTAHIPASHADDIADIENQLAAAGQLARAERAPLLKINPGTDTSKAVLRRSTDWSQVRPEWGLAGCAAFIVAPRERTQTVDLDGRSFLHSYDWQQDDDFSVLALIMSAPMVVASWINLQYYASTVDNEVFGSGNKTLHNVVGTLGVLEGNGGDLRVGLPWQSVHDGDTYIHEPLRLTVMIEAPTDAMTDIIARHESVRQLVDNGWLDLFALDETGAVAYQYAGDLTWTAV